MLELSLGPFNTKHDGFKVTLASERIHIEGNALIAHCDIVIDIASKNVQFLGLNHLLTTGTYYLIL